MYVYVYIYIYIYYEPHAKAVQGTGDSPGPHQVLGQGDRVIALENYL